MIDITRHETYGRMREGQRTMVWARRVVGRRCGRTRGWGRGALGAVVLIAGLLAAATPAPARAATLTQPVSNCMVSIAPVKRPAPVLAMESFELRVRVSPLCRPRVYPVHLVFAIAVREGMTPREQQLAIRELQDAATALVELDRDTVRIGIAATNGRGMLRCPISGDERRIRACLAHLDRVEPSKEVPMARAIEEAMRMLRRAETASHEGEARDMIYMALLSPSDRRPMQNGGQRGAAAEWSCRDALAAAGVAKKEGVLMLASALGGPSGWVPASLRRCIRSLATSSRYVLPPGTLRWLFGHRILRMIPGPTMTDFALRIGLPEHVSVEQVTVSDGFAGLAVRPHDVAVSSFQRPFELSFVMRASRPGRHPLSDPVEASWRESRLLDVEQVLPPIGEVLALAPRRLATATPTARPVSRSGGR